MLHVDGGDHRDAGVEQLFDVHPAFRPPAARCVRVGQFVDEDDVGPPEPVRRNVEFGETAAAVVDVARRDDSLSRRAVRRSSCGRGSRPPQPPGRCRAQAPVRLAEHREGLADTRRRTEGRCTTRPASAWSRARRAAHRSPTTCRRRFAAGSHSRGLDGVHASIIRRSIHRSISFHREILVERAMLSLPRSPGAPRRCRACGPRCGTRRVGELRLDSLRGSSRRARSEVRRRRGDVRPGCCRWRSPRRLTLQGRPRPFDRHDLSCRVVRTAVAHTTRMPS